MPTCTRGKPAEKPVEAKPTTASQRLASGPTKGRPQLAAPSLRRGTTPPPRFPGELDYASARATSHPQLLQARVAGLAIDNLDLIPVRP